MAAGFHTQVSVRCVTLCVHMCAVWGVSAGNRHTESNRFTCCEAVTKQMHTVFTIHFDHIVAWEEFGMLRKPFLCESAMTA